MTSATLRLFAGVAASVALPLIIHDAALHCDRMQPGWAFYDGVAFGIAIMTFGVCGVMSAPWWSRRSRAHD